ncbi:MAG: hypothetical protein BIFFINMI_04371 [Phycisphaerae bacterium]|nr:hypothetical protein [Phycisphaerae bacterium]
MQAPRVDEDRELAAVARAAAARVGPEAPVASWNALDSVFLYYFGRDVPEAMRYHNYLIREHGKVGADRSWNDWLADRGRVPWMITRDIDNNREAMEERGFAAVEGLPTTSNPRERTILMYHVGRSGRRSASRPAESTP